MVRLAKHFLLISIRNDLQFESWSPLGDLGVEHVRECNIKKAFLSQ